jgi:hypothetical protein
MSNELNINRGIVQGSALGPFLFTIMISDLKTLSLMNDLVKYADDSTIAVRSDSDVPIVKEHSNAKNWSITNNLPLNDPKTKLMSFHRKVNIIDNVPGIELVHETTLLGVIIDDKLCFSNHVSSILSTCSQRFYLLKLLRDQGTPISVLNTIYQSLIVSRITYCVSAWGGFIREVDIQRINSMFKRAKRYGFTDASFDFIGLLKYHDMNLFGKMYSPSHCLHHILPESIQRSRPSRNSVYHHSFIIPKTRTVLYRKSFLSRVLYEHSPYT